MLSRSSRLLVLSIWFQQRFRARQAVPFASPFRSLLLVFFFFRRRVIVVGSQPTGG